jgi:hypothetical protein
MVVKVTVKKGSGCRIQVAISRPQSAAQVQVYASGEAARVVLLEMGIPADALEFYFSQLLPWLLPNQELEFPSIDIPEYELAECGFRIAKTG